MSTFTMVGGHLVPYVRTQMTEAIIEDLRGYTDEDSYLYDLAHRAADRLEQLAAICTDMAEFDLCDLDGHGYCQAHLWLHTDPPCPHLRARATL
jgi:hypothetical protein